MKKCGLRVALCLSGRFANFDSCLESLEKNLIQVCHPDIFVHTWRDQDWAAAELLVVERLKPAVVAVEDFECWQSSEKNFGIPEVLLENEPKASQSCVPMFYKIFACNNSRRNFEQVTAVKYDIVIRMRPDFYLYGKIPSCFFSTFRCILLERNLVNLKFQRSDKFAIGPPYLMDYYSSIYPRIRQYWRRPLGDYPPYTLKVGERLMFTHLRANDVPVKNVFVPGFIHRGSKRVRRHHNAKVQMLFDHMRQIKHGLFPPYRSL